MHDSADPKPSQVLASAPAPVPVFNCVVYLAASSNGRVRARVANLPGLECEATSERAALQSIVALFKSRVAELLASQAPIPWIEPPPAAAPEEKIRFIGVHL